jgi:hypothetical protein
MKKILCLAVSLLALNLTPVFGQDTFTIDNGRAVIPSKAALTKFNLDFPGGTPAQLVNAIEKATGKPLNAIIPDEDADIKLPPLKMDDVDVVQLFAALEQASIKQIAIKTGNNSFNAYSTFVGGYGFRTADNKLTDDSIWYFHMDKPSLPPVISTEKVCQFYSLAPYLDRGFTVDDITTAIQTGWKMSGETEVPELNYHKETKLLIAFGEPDKLKTIENVLQTLPVSTMTHNEIDSMKSQIKELQDQVGALKKEILDIPSPGRRPVPSAEKSGN